MGISRWFYRFTDEPVNSVLLEEKPKVDEEKKEVEITFESDKELLERNRVVKVGSKSIGHLVLNDGKWRWLQSRSYIVGAVYGSTFIAEINMETMIAITEKLKELNGCSDVQLEIKRLEQRLTQLEMMNSSSLARNQADDIVTEINGIRKRLYDISHNEYARKQSEAYGYRL